MKKITIIFMAALLVVCSGLMVFADSLVKIYIDGEELQTDTQLKNGKAIASVRDIAEALGASVSWDADTNSVIIKTDKGGTQDERISRLQQALIPQDHKSAANAWAEAVKMRNGALQYALLSPVLQEEKYSQYADMNWSTGTSSPWIKGYSLTEKGKLQEGEYLYQIQYVYTDSTQSEFMEYQNIIVENTDMGWTVSSIDNISVVGTITEIDTDEEGIVKSIFVEGSDKSIGTYDKARVLIGEDTLIYKGYSTEKVKAEDLEKGSLVEATFVEGPMIMIYPPQAMGKVIRVLE